MRWSLAAAILGVATSALAQAPPPVPTRWVTDRAGFLSPAARTRLDARLEGYERASGHQILVWIDRSTGGLPLEDFSIRAVSAWKVGRQGIDDGLVLFLFSEDRKARIEVGYGLEGTVPDAIASRVIRDTLAPALQAGDRDGGVERSVEALIGVIGGGGGGPPPDRRELAGRPAPSPLAIVLFSVLALLVIGFVVTHPVLAARLFFEILLAAGRGGRGGGWGGGGGGGFSGGGGRFGGGGASGSW